MRRYARCGRASKILIAVIALTALALWLGGRAAGAVKLAAWALIAAYLMEPLVARYQKRMRRAPAALMAFLTVFICVLGVACAVLLPALTQLKQLPAYLAQAGARLQTALNALRDKAALAGLDAFAALPGADYVSNAGARLLSFALLSASSAVSALTRVMIVCALAFFYLMDWKLISLRLALFVPGAQRQKAIRAAMAVRRELGAYLRAQITVILTVSLMAVVALTLVGAPMPLAMGLMYGLLNAVPYFGPLIGTIPPVLAALSIGWPRALITLISLLLLQQIDNYALSPRVMGAASGASPAMVLLAISAGGAVGGAGGMLLALPALVTMRVLFRVCISAKE